MKLKTIKEVTSGDIKYTTYSCPCGEGTIEEENDYTPGHRDCIAFLQCQNCEEEYYINYDNSQLHWCLSSKNVPINKTYLGGNKMDNLWLLTEERPKPSVVKQIMEYIKDFNDTLSIENDTLKSNLLLKMDILNLFMLLKI